MDARGNSQYFIMGSRTSRKKFNDRRNKQDIRYTLMTLVCPQDDIFHIKCVKCGFDNYNGLQFDHKNNDGAQDRKRFKSHNAMMSYYLKNPEEAQEKLQVLCANCNWIKRNEKYV